MQVEILPFHRNMSLSVISTVKKPTFYSIYTFIRALSGVFMAMTGLILFLRRARCCRVWQLISGLRRKGKPAANPPEVYIQVRKSDNAYDWSRYYLCVFGRSMNRCCECTHHNYGHAIFHINTTQVGYIVLYIHIITVSIMLQSIIILILQV